jgi:hypothetical protein
VNDARAQNTTMNAARTPTVSAALVAAVVGTFAP